MWNWSELGHIVEILFKIGWATWLLCRLEKKVPMFVKDLEMNDSYLEQRVNIQPSLKLEIYANKTFDMFKEMSRTKLFVKYKKFKQSRKDELDDWWINYLTIDKTIGILDCSNGLFISEIDKNKNDG